MIQDINSLEAYLESAEGETDEIQTENTRDDIPKSHLSTSIADYYGK